MILLLSSRVSVVSMALVVERPSGAHSFRPDEGHTEEAYKYTIGDALITVQLVTLVLSRSYPPLRAGTQCATVASESIIMRPVSDLLTK